MRIEYSIFNVENRGTVSFLFFVCLLQNLYKVCKKLLCSGEIVVGFIGHAIHLGIMLIYLFLVLIIYVCTRGLNVRINERNEYQNNCHFAC